MWSQYSYCIYYNYCNTKWEHVASSSVSYFLTLVQLVKAHWQILSLMGYIPNTLSDGSKALILYGAFLYINFLLICTYLASLYR